ncbi:MAG: response regulator [Methylobacteriaceae bacterium]|nr:response regulator [Methylobacteriaceae bacterium]
MRSINRKLGHLVVVAVGTVTLVVGATGAWQEANRYLDAKRETLVATAQAFAAASAAAVAAGDAVGATRAISGIAAVPNVPFAAVERRDGRLLAEIGGGVRLLSDLDITERTGISPLALLRTDTVGVAVPIVREGEEVGRLSLVGLTDDLGARLRDVLLTAAAGALVALALGFLVSFRLQRSITRPLLALTATMGEIRASHDYARAVAIRSDDEVGILADTFNAMMGEVRLRDDELVGHRDRLEVKVAERTHDLRLAKEDAEAANVAKSEFLATMSHEIRTPMNGLLVMAELLAGAQLPDRERRYAEVIARSGQSLLAIINDILDFSKIESGKMTLEEIAFSPAEIVDTVVTLFAERASGKGLDLAAYLAPDLPETLVGDPVRVTQVVSNLVNNALKFAEAGHVLVRVEREGEGVRFSVVDTGIGIAADKLGTIFTAFSQADQSTTRRFGGTGLGLSICKRLVEAMGGEIGATSRLGEGSTFSFRLPTEASGIAIRPAARALNVHLRVAGDGTRSSLAASLAALGIGCDEGRPADALVADARDLAVRPGRDAAPRIVALAGMGDPTGQDCLRRGLADALIRRPVVQAEWREIVARLRDELPFDAGPREAESAGTASSAGLAGRRVLVVDDAAVNREVACEALARLGIAAETAEGGVEGVEKALTGRYDLVLMDGSMPDVDGYEAARRIRAAEAGTARRTRVVALTAHVVGAAAEAWREAGMDDVLHKPFTVAKLAACLERHLADVPPVAEAPVPPSPAKDEDAGLLDGDTLAALSEMGADGGAAFLGRVLGLFEQNAPLAMADLLAAAEAADAALVASGAHKLKSMSLNIGAARLATVLARVEAEARDAATLPDRSTLDEVATLLARSLAALAAALRDTGGESRDAAA